MGGSYYWYDVLPQMKSYAGLKKVQGHKHEFCEQGLRKTYAPLKCTWNHIPLPGWWHSTWTFSLVIELSKSWNLGKEIVLTPRFLPTTVFRFPNFSLLQHSEWVVGGWTLVLQAQLLYLACGSVCDSVVIIFVWHYLCCSVCGTICVVLCVALCVWHWLRLKIRS